MYHVTSWNFSGRQNDTQGQGLHGRQLALDVDFIDAEHLGSDSVPTARAEDKAHNRFCLFPLCWASSAWCSRPSAAGRISRSPACSSC